MRNTDIHDDLRQLSHGSITARNFNRYDINGFRFRTAKLEASRPLAATTNSGVVTKACDARGKEINYYGLIQNIIEYKFGGPKELIVAFFECDWFDPNTGTRVDEFAMVEVKHESRLQTNNNFVLAHQVEQVYYLNYPHPSLQAWWVVYKVNPHERLYPPGDNEYVDPSIVDDELDVYQEEGLPRSFPVDDGAGLQQLLVDLTEQPGPSRKRARGSVTIRRRITTRLSRQRVGNVTPEADEF